MAKYIPLDALLAEIDRRIASLESIGSENYLHDKYPVQYAMLVTLKSLRFSIDTVEVKEVDLEKHLKEDIEDIFFDLNGVAVKGATHYLTVEDVKDIARHFFELGLKVAQKGE